MLTGCYSLFPERLLIHTILDTVEPMGGLLKWFARSGKAILLLCALSPDLYADDIASGEREASASTAPEWFSEKTIPETLKGIEGYRLKIRYESVWNPAFLEWRKSIGHPLQIHDAVHSGTIVFLRSAGNYRCDIYQVYRNGKVMRDETQTFDGQHWKRFNRYNQLNYLSTSRLQASQEFEFGDFACPFATGFAFLLEPYKRTARKTKDRKMLWLWQDGMSKIGSEDLWDETFSRLLHRVEVKPRKGKAGWHFVADGGVAEHNGGGDRMKYTVCLPFEEPLFPSWIEARFVDADAIFKTFEVSEYLRTNIGGESDSLLFPKMWTVSTYNYSPAQSGFGNLPYLEINLEIDEIEWNPEVPPEEFDPVTGRIRKIHNLDTGEQFWMNK